jgi:hypothetical protein
MRAEDIRVRGHHGRNIGALDGADWGTARLRCPLLCDYSSTPCTASLTTCRVSAGAIISRKV